MDSHARCQWEQQPAPHVSMHGAALPSTRTGKQSTDTTVVRRVTFSTGQHTDSISRRCDRDDPQKRGTDFYMAATAPDATGVTATSAPAPREPEDNKPPSMYDLIRALKALEKEDVVLKWRPEARGMVLLVFSEKGGVGKTALTNAIATVLAFAGKKVLVIDLDPRATATSELGIAIGKDDFGVNDILYVDPEDPEPADATGSAAEVAIPANAENEWPQNIHVLPSSRVLGNREKDTTPGIERRLQQSLEGVKEEYDLVIVDVPPRAGGTLVAAAVLAGTHAIFPATMNEDGFDGVTDAMTSIRRTRATTGMSPLRIVGIIRNIVDPSRTNSAVEYDGIFREEWPADSTERCSTCQKNDAPHCDHVLRLIEDLLIPKYDLRVQARNKCVPFMLATTKESEWLRRAYTLLVNHISEAA
jgi:chromosome partitioning protein